MAEDTRSDEHAGDDFVVSMRLSWNVKDQDLAAIAEQVTAYREAGIGALHISPDRGDIDGWLTNQEAVAKAVIA